MEEALKNTIEEVDNVPTVIKKIKKEVCTEQYQLISIDGRSGSGKTMLSTEITQQLNIEHINLDDDDYLKKKQDEFVDAIKYGSLLSKIEVARKENKPILIEGICIIKILERIKVIPTFKIYVKKTIVGGFWLDGTDYDYTIPLENTLQRLEEELKKITEITSKIDKEDISENCTKEGITIETLRYHYEYHPDLEADLIYTRESIT